LVVRLLLEITDLAVEVNGKEILKDIDLYIRQRRDTCSSRPNGSGKSTLFMAMLGSRSTEWLGRNNIQRGRYNQHDNHREGWTRSWCEFPEPPAIRGVNLKTCLI